MPLETNTYKWKSKNSNYADWSGYLHLREAIKQKVFLQKAKPPNQIKPNQKKQSKQEDLWYLSKIYKNKFSSLLNSCNIKKSMYECWIKSIKQTNLKYIRA